MCVSKHQASAAAPGTRLAPLSPTQTDSTTDSTGSSTEHSYRRMSIELVIEGSSWVS